MRILLRLLSGLRPYKRQVFLAWLCLTGASAFTLAQPKLVAWAIDFGLTGSGGAQLLVVVAAAPALAALALPPLSRLALPGPPRGPAAPRAAGPGQHRAAGRGPPGGPGRGAGIAGLRPPGP